MKTAMHPSPRSRLARFGAAALFIALLGACQTPDHRPVRPFGGPSTPAEVPKRAGFTCCNLHYEGDWISDANWGALPFIPAGTPISLTGSKGYHLLVQIDGKPMRIGLDYGRERITLDRLAEQTILPYDPRLNLAKWPANMQQAIKAGKIMVGMTREQVIMAVGYPQADQTRSLNAFVWNYWASSFGQYMLHWGKNGELERIESDSVTYNKMVFKPR